MSGIKTKGPGTWDNQNITEGRIGDFPIKVKDKGNPFGRGDARSVMDIMSLFGLIQTEPQRSIRNRAGGSFFCFALGETRLKVNFAEKMVDFLPGSNVF